MARLLLFISLDGLVVMLLLFVFCNRSDSGGLYIEPITEGTGGTSASFIFSSRVGSIAAKSSNLADYNIDIS